MISCLRTRVRKQPIIALYFESETVLKFYNIEAKTNFLKETYFYDFKGAMTRTPSRFARLDPCIFIRKNSEYDREIPQSQTADKPMAQRERESHTAITRHQED